MKLAKKGVPRGTFGTDQHVASRDGADDVKWWMQASRESTVSRKEVDGEHQRRLCELQVTH